MARVNIVLPAQAPQTLDPASWQAINDLYIQFNSLVNQLNQNNNIIQSPNGHYWRVNVSNAGAVSTTDLGLVLPPLLP